MQKTGERLISGDAETRIERMWLARGEFAYRYAAKLLDDLFVRPQVLDIGCADGFGAEILARGGKTHVIGLDHDLGTIDRARRERASKTVDFICGDALKIPYFTSQFDFVTSFQMIEHVDDDSGLVREIHRVLTPGGLLVMTTPNRVYRLRPGQRPWNRFHAREYDATGFEALLRRSFSHVNILGIHGTPEVEALERSRVALMYRSLFWSWVRRTVPESCRRVLARTGLFHCDRPPTVDFKAEDFHADDDNVDSSLDLLAVCQR